MKISNIRNLFLISLALPLVMLFGCSSSEEAPPADDTGGGGSCENCSQYSNQVDITECEARNAMRGDC